MNYTYTPPNPNILTMFTFFLEELWEKIKEWLDPAYREKVKIVTMDKEGKLTVKYL